MSMNNSSIQLLNKQIASWYCSDYCSSQSVPGISEQNEVKHIMWMQCQKVFRENDPQGKKYRKKKHLTTFFWVQNCVEIWINQK